MLPPIDCGLTLNGHANRRTNGSLLWGKGINIMVNMPRAGDRPSVEDQPVGAILWGRSLNQLRPIYFTAIVTPGVLKTPPTTSVSCNTPVGESGGITTLN